MPEGALDAALHEAIGPGWAGGRTEPEIYQRLTEILGVDPGRITEILEVLAAHQVLNTGLVELLAGSRPEAQTAILPAARVLQDNLGRGLSRMGESHTKGLGYLADAASNAAAVGQAYKEARTAILHQAEIEKAVVQSASVLWTNVDDGKKKTANAIFKKVELNGKVIHENAEVVKGATGGSINNTEVPVGPLMFQGDHGTVAFRNIRITSRK